MQLVKQDDKASSLKSEYTETVDKFAALELVLAQGTV